MGLVQNLKVYFSQESLPITYHHFCHQNLVRPKSKSSSWKGSQLISYKANFSQKETMHLTDVKFNITYQNEQRIIKVRSLLRTEMSLNETLFFRQLTVWFFNLMGSPDIMLVFRKTINKLDF